MTATRLVVHHAYERGSAFDLSENGNHGHLTSVGAGSGAFEGSLRFTGGPSRVDVRPHPTLAAMRSIAVRARFFLDPQGGAHRHNLVEGHLSFALLVESNGALTGSILDATGTWRAPQTSPGAVTNRVWHEAAMFHDGISHARLFLDGTLAAERFDIPGPIRDVANFGLAIGHWPDPDDRYTLEGHIDDVKVWRDDPADEVAGLIDACCVDRGGIDALLERMRNEGWTFDQLQALMTELLELRTELGIAVRAGDPGRSARTDQLTGAAMAAYLQRDGDALNAGLDAIGRFAAEAMDESEFRHFGERAMAILEQSPVRYLLVGGKGEDGLDRVDGIDGGTRPDLWSLLCLGGLRPPPRRRRRPEAEDRPPDGHGDPDVDREPDQPPPGWDLPAERMDF